MDSHQPITHGGAAGNREIEPSASGGDHSEYLGDAEDDPGTAAFCDLVREGDALVGRVRESTESLRATNNWFQESNGRIEQNLTRLETALREDSDTGGDTGESNPTDEPVQLEPTEPVIIQIAQTPQSSARAKRQLTPKQPERPKQSKQSEQPIEQRPDDNPVQVEAVDRHNPSRRSVDWER